VTEDVGYPKHSGWGSDAAVPYASLSAVWLFHLQHVGAGCGALELAPLVRVDWFPFADSASNAFSSGSFAWTFTTGFALGWGGAGRPGD